MHQSPYHHCHHHYFWIDIKHTNRFDPLTESVILTTDREAGLRVNRKPLGIGIKERNECFLRKNVFTRVILFFGI